MHVPPQTTDQANITMANLIKVPHPQNTHRYGELIAPVRPPLPPVSAPLRAWSQPRSSATNAGPRPPCLRHLFVRHAQLLRPNSGPNSGRTTSRAECCFPQFTTPQWALVLLLFLFFIFIIIAFCIIISIISIISATTRSNLRWRWIRFDFRTICAEQPSHPPFRPHN